MGDMGDASGPYLHGQSFTYEPLHTVTDGGGGGEKYEKFTLSTKKINMFHYQTHVSKCTMSPNKPKPWSLQPRKVYCRAMQGERWLMLPQTLLAETF